VSLDLFSKALHGELIAYFRPEYVDLRASDMFRCNFADISGATNTANDNEGMIVLKFCS